MRDKISEQIKGHDKIQFQISQALQNNRLPHALLFSGPSGVGKRQLAWALAQSLLCENTNHSSTGAAPFNLNHNSIIKKTKQHSPFLKKQTSQDKNTIYPCGHCLSCLNIIKKQSENVLCVTHETLQIRLQDVQTIPPFLSLQSFAKAKVVLIDSAEKLNSQASNFLLKIIEEPPPKSFFFLISSNPTRLSLTIRSRIQNLRFQALPEQVLRELCPGDTAQWIIRGSRGRWELLEKLRDQKELRDYSFDLWFKMFKKSFKALEVDFQKKINNRKEALSILDFFQQFLRDLRFFKLGYIQELIHGDKTKEMTELSPIPCRVLDLFIKKTLEMEADLQAHSDYVLCFENFAITVQKNNKKVFS